MSTPQPFDLLGPLPQGTTVLEASAGTGKTFTIAGLVARYVAEGVATMDQLLVVSFSRESTRELRERVRERLVRARDGLHDPPATDHLLVQLADCDPAERSRRHRRLQDALAAFDAATVTTTHGFCQQVLQALGTAGDYDSGAVLVEDLGDLVSEVSDDLYLRKWGAPGSAAPELSTTDFRALAHTVVKDLATPLVPDPAAATGLPALRARIAAGVRTEVEVRKRRQRLLGYDDMLLRLATTLADPVSGPGARARLRARYRIVLVDEFQDTDPVQWAILREAFHEHRTLVLIGDPKQAIYAFRGADVHAYLQACAVAASQCSLPVNWRSDAALLRGLDAVFRGAALGDGRIRVGPVEASYDGRLLDAPEAVRLRVLTRADLPQTQQGLAATPAAREAVATDVAAEVTALLASTTTLRPRDGSPPRPLEPGDVAVLVRTHAQSELVRRHLAQAGVPVVVTGRTDVFATPAALEWQLLLEAVEQPHRTTRVRRFALGAFVGQTAASLDTDTSEELALQLRGWRRLLEERGVAALFEVVCRDREVQSRLLGQTGGERLLTDLRHLTEALHEAALEGQLGLNALLGWLRHRRADTGTDGAQERSRRLESDADAVQVITIHTSKGLEFPVVLVPFAWDRFDPKTPPTAVFHDAADRRVRDVGGSGSPDWAAHLNAHKREETDDELRLTYVALTRAQGQLVLWWAGSHNTPTAPLHRLLLHTEPDGVPPRSLAVPSDEAALTAFRALAAASDGGLTVEVVDQSTVTPFVPPAHPAPDLSVAAFTRPLDTRWHRTSYTGLTAAAHEQHHPFGSEPEVPGKDDEPEAAAAGAGLAAYDGGPVASTPSLWDELPGGASFGTLVHEVLERLDDPADSEALRALVRAQAGRWSPDLDAELLADALQAAVATPLGELAGGRALTAFPRADRLPELDFELPLAGGDDPTGAEVVLSDLVPLWREHVPTGLLSTYPDALASLGSPALRGYLTGSVDAVLRAPSGDGERYLVVDYKTNRLGVRGVALTDWDYRPDQLEAAMIEAHYPLQALLYDVALHRYLRWRLPGYDPERHLGGALYLFLRGLTGPQATHAPGVFGWRPPAALVTATSDLLAGVR